VIRREEDNGVTILTQTAHSWISGQLGVRWGNERFRPPVPREEVLLAIDQHDYGWADWEQRPRLRPDGRPMGFMEMDLADHLAIWRRSAASIATRSLYAALLVSLHGVGLISMRLERTADPPESKDAIRAFLAEQQREQEGLKARLAALARYAPNLADPVLTANLRLVQACDALSLMLCVPWHAERQVVVPGGPDGDDLTTVVAHLTDERTLVVDPWPFGEASFTVCAEARRLGRAVFDDEGTFHAELAAAPVLYLECRVRQR
jgi:hypothetical protein